MRSLTTLIAAVCTLVSFALTTNIVVKDGIYFNEDGSLFSGEYEQFESGIKLATISVNNGLLSGSAVYYHANGAIKEEGTFVNGKRSGSWFQYTSSGELTSVAAFNNDKKVIITGYGGHTEYLGKDYDGLVDYKLNSLAINESVFFPFKLDDTYKWAIADKEHAVKLLRSKLDVKNKIEFINLGKGFYSLEKSNEQSLQILNDKITFVFVDDLYPDRCLEIIKTYEKNGITNIKLLGLLQRMTRQLNWFARGRLYE